MTVMTLWRVDDQMTDECIELTMRLIVSMAVSVGRRCKERNDCNMRAVGM